MPCILAHKSNSLLTPLTPHIEASHSSSTSLLLVFVSIQLILSKSLDDCLLSAESTRVKSSPTLSVRVHIRLCAKAMLPWDFLLLNGGKIFGVFWERSSNEIWIPRKASVVWRERSWWFICCITKQYRPTLSSAYTKCSVFQISSGIRGLCDMNQNERLLTPYSAHR